MNKSLRTINVEYAKRIESSVRICVKPGQQLCPTCAMKVNSFGDESDDLTEPDINAEYDPLPDCNEQLNEYIAPLGISPIKTHGIKTKDIVLYGKRKNRMRSKCSCRKNMQNYGCVSK